MPLLRNGRLTDDNPWVRVEDDADWPTGDVPALIGLSRFIELASAHQLPVSVSVVLAPDDDPLALQPWIDRLQLVCISFPSYTDGRGYSQARLLRQRLGFAGELRAVGDVRADQLLEMMRVGIDAFDFGEHDGSDRPAPDAALIDSLLKRYGAFYQPSYPLAIAG